MRYAPGPLLSALRPPLFLLDFLEQFMYIILVYDVNEKRVGRALKVCRQYLNWVQNSVFEGESTPARLKELTMRLKRVIEEDEDSVLIYKFAEQRLLEKRVLGRERNPTGTFL